MIIRGIIRDVEEKIASNMTNYYRFTLEAENADIIYLQAWFERNSIMNQIQINKKDNGETGDIASFIENQIINHCLAEKGQLELLRIAVIGCEAEFDVYEINNQNESRTFNKIISITRIKNF